MPGKTPSVYRLQFQQPQSTNRSHRKPESRHNKYRLKETATARIIPDQSTLPTPLKPARLHKLLSGYFNRDHIVQTFCAGCVLEFKGPQRLLMSHNSPTIAQNYEAAKAKIMSEVDAGRISCPFAEPPFKKCKCSPRSLRPKQQAGKFRLLHNLSYPYDDTAVNFNISQADASVKYDSLKDAVKLVRACAPHAYMAKSGHSRCIQAYSVTSRSILSDRFQTRQQFLV